MQIRAAATVDVETPFILMDFHPQGNLRTFIRDHQHTLPMVIVLAKDILCGLECLHSQRLVHGAIKPEVIHSYYYKEGQASCADLSRIFCCGKIRTKQSEPGLQVTVLSANLVVPNCHK